MPRGNTVHVRIDSLEYDINVSDTSDGWAGGRHIVTGNLASRIGVASPSCVIVDNITTDIIGTSTGGKIGPNLVGGIWV